VPPEIVSLSRCYPPLKEEDVEHVVFAQLSIIYGTSWTKQIHNAMPNPVTAGGA
jgi:hypothetical protein